VAGFKGGEDALKLGHQLEGLLRAINEKATMLKVEVCMGKVPIEVLAWSFTPGNRVCPATSIGVLTYLQCLCVGDCVVLCAGCILQEGVLGPNTWVVQPACTGL
jgi:hypothetical protein